MYYFEKNIQRYRSDTAHLSLLEHGVYNQLIDWYYLDEKPIPLDRALVYRRLCARSEDERAAVDVVLADFFEEADDGWHQKHCDAVVAEFQEGAAAAEEGRQHERDRKRRYRDRRAELFAVLRDNGVVPPFDTKIEMLERMALPYLSRGTSVGQSPDTGGTSGARPAVGTAITINNKQETNSALIVREAPDPTEAVDKSGEEGLPLAAAWREMAGEAPQGATARVLTALAGEGCAAAHLRVAWAVARERKPLPERISVAYVAPIVRDARDGKLAVQRAQRGAAPASAAQAWQHDDNALVAKGGELGLSARPGESYPRFRARVGAEIEKRMVAA